MTSLWLSLHRHRGYPQRIGVHNERPADGSWCGVVSLRWVSIRLGIG